VGHAAVWGSISFCPKRRHTPLLRLTRTLGGQRKKLHSYFLCISSTATPANSGFSAILMNQESDPSGPNSLANWRDPAMLALHCCCFAYLIFKFINFDGWRDLFLWATLAFGGVGICSAIAAKYAAHQYWIKFISSFTLNWFFVAYVISLLTR